jgi:hypothetical protein
MIQLYNAFGWLVKRKVCLLFDWIATPSARKDVGKGWVATHPVRNGLTIRLRASLAMYGRVY